jgi:hypothetical protein
MNLPELQQFLEKYAGLIPTYSKPQKTFLEIAKQPHYENVISNMYAFFFNVYEEHGFNDLFIKSLIECIEARKISGKDFSNFTDFEIETEYSTSGIGKNGKRGRIDLLLSNDQQAIIIENKIYHYLANDLDDYWHSVKLKAENDSAKIGIILSLKPISTDLYQHFEKKNEFISLTHAELLKKVMENLAIYLTKCEAKYVHFLEDFNQNIINLSSQTMNSQDINFYVDNKTSINQLVLFKQQFKKHVTSEVERAGASIAHVKTIIPKHKFNAKRLRYFQSTKHPELLYTIVYGELFDENGILDIIIEPRGTALKNGKLFESIQFDENEKMVLQKDFYSKTNEAWAHFAAAKYTLTVNDIADLSSFIQTKINEDHFASIFSKLEYFLMQQGK